MEIMDGVFEDTMTAAVFVEFDSFLVALDAPWDHAAGTTAISAAADRFPGKPVKYLVISHTHPDHAGGARAYFDRGVTTIVPPDAVPFYRRLAGRRPYPRDPYDSTARPPRIEPLVDERTITDGRRTLRLFIAGPTPHTAQTIIGVFPASGLIWQVDLFFGLYRGELMPAARPGSPWLAAWLKDRGIEWRYILDTHMAKVFSREAFDESIRRMGPLPTRR